jgi:hypothetical protein
MFCIPVRRCPSSPLPSSPTRGEGGVWALLPRLPPPPISPNGRRGSLGVLMTETGDGTQGLAKKSTPLPHGKKEMSGRPDKPFPQCSLALPDGDGL